MRVIAIPREENDVLDEDRARLGAWAPKNDWVYVEYGNAIDLLAKMTDLRSQSDDLLTVIEVVAHGNPSLCDDVSLGNTVIIAESLKRLASDETSVYLSACNTGLELNGECVAQAFAVAFGGPVFGARGYIGGTFAEQTEQCFVSVQHDGIIYHGYPGAVDAVGREVWTRFGPVRQADNGDDMQIKIATSGFRPIRLAGEQTRQLVASVEQVLRTPPAHSARLRMAPDLTFTIRLEDGEHLFELLAGGTVLRDPISRQVWQFDGGRTILQSLLPFRTLPAA